MNKTKNSWIYDVFAAEFDMATDMFCIIQAIDAGKFDIAMFHHFEYLLHKDEWSKLMNSRTEKQLISYWNFEDAIQIGCDEVQL